MMVLVAFKGAVGSVCGSAFLSFLAVICLKNKYGEGCMLDVRVYWV